MVSLKKLSPFPLCAKMLTFLPTPKSSVSRSFVLSNWSRTKQNLANSEKIERQERSNQAAAKHAEPVNANNVRIDAGKDKEYEPGQQFAMAAMAVAATHGTSQTVPEYIETNFNDMEMAAALDTGSSAGTSAKGNARHCAAGVA